METRHWIIKGKVQGVCFRWYTVDLARKLNLVGWVRNLITGEVEALAQGDNDALNQLETWLQKGPSEALVTEVSSTKVPFQELSSFDKIATASQPQHFS